MKRAILFVFLTLFIFGCDNDHHSTNCCDNHDGVALCYRPIGATHGHIMCRDGYICPDECY